MPQPGIPRLKTFFLGAREKRTISTINLFQIQNSFDNKRITVQLPADMKGRNACCVERPGFA
jgi:hypothetical protein